MPTPTRSPFACILAHEAAYFTTISHAEPRDGWTLFHNVDFRERVDPNHAGSFRAAEGAAASIVREIVDFYRARGITPAAYVDALATPSDLAEHLRAAGFQLWAPGTSDLMLYVGPDVARPTGVPIEIVATAAQRTDWASIVEEEHDQERRVVLNALYLREIADPRITAYLARVDGVPASRAELFSCDGLGRVEAVRTSAEYRGRGLAAALVRRAIEDSLARNEITYIYAEQGGDAQRLYERLGFRTVASDAIRGFLWGG